MGGQFIEVNVAIGKTTQKIQMEKGVTFENKGGIYTVDENGQLKKFDKAGNVWQDAKQIEMTNYQWKAFQNVSNNDGDAATYTKADIEKAQEMYREGKFTEDMSKDLPYGYKIEKPVLNSKDELVQVNVTNGHESQSAILKFQIQEIAELKAASQVSQSSAVDRSNTEPLNISYDGSLMPDPEDVAKYREKFKDMSPENIAKALHRQINGPSIAKKTLAMYDAIPDDKLKDVINAYRHRETRTVHNSFVALNGHMDSSIDKEEKYFNLFTHMASENNIGSAELRPRIARYVDTQALEEKYNSLPVDPYADDSMSPREQLQAKKFQIAYNNLMKNLSNTEPFSVHKSSNYLADMGLSQRHTSWEYYDTVFSGNY